MAKIPITTTINQELYEMLQERDIKVTDILENAAQEVLNRITKKAFDEQNERLRANIILRDRLLKFIESKGLSEEWQKSVLE